MITTFVIQTTAPPPPPPPRQPSCHPPLLHSPTTRYPGNRPAILLYFIHPQHGILATVLPSSFTSFTHNTVPRQPSCHPPLLHSPTTRYPGNRPAILLYFIHPQHGIQATVLPSSFTSFTHNTVSRQPSCHPPLLHSPTTRYPGNRPAILLYFIHPQHGTQATVLSSSFTSFTHNTVSWQPSCHPPLLHSPTTRYPGNRPVILLYFIHPQHGILATVLPSSFTSFTHNTVSRQPSCHPPLLHSPTTRYPGNRPAILLYFIHPQHGIQAIVLPSSFSSFTHNTVSRQPSCHPPLLHSPTTRYPGNRPAILLYFIHPQHGTQATVLPSSFTSFTHNTVSRQPSCHPPLLHSPTTRYPGNRPAILLYFIHPQHGIQATVLPSTFTSFTHNTVSRQPSCHPPLLHSPTTRYPGNRPAILLYFIHPQHGIQATVLPSSFTSFTHNTVSRQPSCHPPLLHSPTTRYPGNRPAILLYFIHPQHGIQATVLPSSFTSFTRNTVSRQPSCHPPLLHSPTTRYPGNRPAILLYFIHPQHGILATVLPSSFTSFTHNTVSWQPSCHPPLLHSPTTRYPGNRSAILLYFIHPQHGIQATVLSSSFTSFTHNTVSWQPSCHPPLLHSPTTRYPGNRPVILLYFIHPQHGIQATVLPSSFTSFTHNTVSRQPSCHPPLLHSPTTRYPGNRPAILLYFIHPQHGILATVLSSSFTSFTHNTVSWQPSCHPPLLHSPTTRYPGNRPAILLYFIHPQHGIQATVLPSTFTSFTHNTVSRQPSCHPPLLHSPTTRYPGNRPVIILYFIHPQHGILATVLPSSFTSFTHNTVSRQPSCHPPLLHSPTTRYPGNRPAILLYFIHPQHGILATVLPSSFTSFTHNTVSRQPSCHPPLLHSPTTRYPGNRPVILLYFIHPQHGILATVLPSSFTSFTHNTVSRQPSCHPPLLHSPATRYPGNRPAIHLYFIHPQHGIQATVLPSSFTSFTRNTVSRQPSCHPPLLHSPTTRYPGNRPAIHLYFIHPQHGIQATVLPSTFTSFTHNTVSRQPSCHPPLLHSPTTRYPGNRPAILLYFIHPQHGIQATVLPSSFTSFTHNTVSRQPSCHPPLLHSPTTRYPGNRPAILLYFIHPQHGIQATVLPSSFTSFTHNTVSRQPSCHPPLLHSPTTRYPGNRPAILLYFIHPQHGIQATVLPSSFTSFTHNTVSRQPSCHPPLLHSPTTRYPGNRPAILLYFIHPQHGIQATVLPSSFTSFTHNTVSRQPSCHPPLLHSPTTRYPGNRPAILLYFIHPQHGIQATVLPSTFTSFTHNTVSRQPSCHPPLLHSPTTRYPGNRPAILLYFIHPQHGIQATVLPSSFTSFTHNTVSRQPSCHPPLLHSPTTRYPGNRPAILLYFIHPQHGIQATVLPSSFTSFTHNTVSRQPSCHPPLLHSPTTRYPGNRPAILLYFIHPQHGIQATVLPSSFTSFTHNTVSRQPSCHPPLLHSPTTRYPGNRPAILLYFIHPQHGIQATVLPSSFTSFTHNTVSRQPSCHPPLLHSPTTRYPGNRPAILLYFIHPQHGILATVLPSSFTSFTHNTVSRQPSCHPPLVHSPTTRYPGNRPAILLYFIHPQHGIQATVLPSCFTSFTHNTVSRQPSCHPPLLHSPTTRYPGNRPAILLYFIHPQHGIQATVLPSSFSSFTHNTVSRQPSCHPALLHSPTTRYPGNRPAILLYFIHPQHGIQATVLPSSFTSFTHNTVPPLLHSPTTRYPGNRPAILLYFIHPQHGIQATVLPSSFTSFTHNTVSWQPSCHPPLLHSPATRYPGNRPAIHLYFIHPQHGIQATVLPSSFTSFTHNTVSRQPSCHPPLLHSPTTRYPGNRPAILLYFIHPQHGIQATVLPSCFTSFTHNTVSRQPSCHPPLLHSPTTRYPGNRPAILLYFIHPQHGIQATVLPSSFTSFTHNTVSRQPSCHPPLLHSPTTRYPGNRPAILLYFIHPQHGIQATVLPSSFTLNSTDVSISKEDEQSSYKWFYYKIHVD